MLKVQSITKILSDAQPTRPISFEADGGVLGVIGTKGSGKSTLLGIISGAIRADEGKIFIDDYDISEYPNEAKRATGFLLEDNPLYDDMTPYEHLMFIGDAKGIPAEKLCKQASEALDLLGIDDTKDVLIANIKKSQRQLLGVAATLLGNPDIIILDEPLKGTTVADAERLSSVIKMLGTMKTVIISSEEASRISGICDRFLLLPEGDFVYTLTDAIEEKEEGAE